MPSDTELAWAAGIVDGEGCITIIHVPAGRQKNCVTDRFTLMLKVTMGHKETVDRINTILGSGTVQHHQSRSEKANASFSYCAQARKAESAIKLILPFLFTKKKEAELALKFMELPLALTGGAGGNKVTDSSLLRKRLAIYWRVRRLKSRWRFYASGKHYRTRGGLPV